MKFKYKNFEIEISPALIIPCVTDLDFSIILEQITKLFS